MAKFAKTTGWKGQGARRASLKPALRASVLAACLALPSAAIAQSNNDTIKPATIPAISQSSTGTSSEPMRVETLERPQVLTITPRQTLRRKPVWKTRTLTRTRSGAFPAAGTGDNAAPFTPANAADTAQSGITGRDGNSQIAEIDTALRGTLFSVSDTRDLNPALRLGANDTACLDTLDTCLRQDRGYMDVGYSFDITKSNDKGIDFQVTPRANFGYDDDGSQTALLGALVRIGDNLRADNAMADKTWYLFAGADAEAVTYTPSSFSRLAQGEFRLRDRIIVGDAQAGVGYRLGGADLALTYFRRQAKVDEFSFNEDAAALSLTWRR